MTPPPDEVQVVLVGDGLSLRAQGDADAWRVTSLAGQPVGVLQLPVAGPEAWMPAEVAIGDVVVVARRVGGTWRRWEGPVQPPAAKVPLSTDMRPDLRIVEVVLPVDAGGRDDGSWAADVVPIGPPPLAAAASWFGVERPWAVALPVAWQRVDIHNAEPEAVNAVVRARVVDDEGIDVPAWRYRGRDTSAASATALLLLPPLTTTSVTLPLWYDPDAPLGEGGWTRAIDVAVVGGPKVASFQGPLRGAAGAGVATSVAAAGTAGALAGGIWMRARWSVWWESRRLVSRVALAMIAMVGTVANAATGLFGLTLGAALGPLGPFVWGVFDDGLRAGLLAILLRWQPGAGTAASFIVLTAVARWILFGAFHPVELVHLGLSVVAHEAALAATGASAGGRERWRLALALGAAGGVTTAVSLAWSALWTHQHFAPEWAVAVVLLPGIMYPAVAAWPATRIADRLASVAP